MLVDEDPKDGQAEAWYGKLEEMGEETVRHYRDIGRYIGQGIKERLVNVWLDKKDQARKDKKHTQTMAAAWVAIIITVTGLGLQLFYHLNSANDKGESVPTVQAPPPD